MKTAEQELSFASLAEALVAAKRWEAPRVPYYVARNQADDTYVVTAHMPLLGEWWTSDGIKHG